MKGITLIELSVALSILAILAAVLLPRMAQLQRAARVGELKGLHGELSARVLLVHIATTVRGDRPDAQPCAGGGGSADNRRAGPGTVCTEGGLIHTLHGYPASTPLGTPGVVAAAGVVRLHNPSSAQLQAAGWRVRVEGGTTTFSRADASDPDTCSVRYTQAADAASAASISVPVVSGC